MRRLFRERFEETITMMANISTGPPEARQSFGPS